MVGLLKAAALSVSCGGIRKFQQGEQHGHRRFGYDGVVEFGRHAYPKAGSGFAGVLAERQDRLAAQDLDDGRHWSPVLGQSIPGGETEEDNFGGLIVLKSPAQMSGNRHL